MEVGTVTVLSTEEEFSKLKDEKSQANICVVKTPKIWQWCDKSRASSSEGGEKLRKWTNISAKLCETDCKFNYHCNIDCKTIDDCKLFVMRTDEGVVQVKS